MEPHSRVGSGGSGAYRDRLDARDRSTSVDLSQRTAVRSAAEIYDVGTGQWRSQRQDVQMDGPYLARGASIAGWVEARGIARRDDVEVDEQGAFSLGAAVRGIVTGRWDGAETERRALSSGASATGGVLVPTLVSAQVIDALVDRATALQAGARIVPMGSESVKLPKIASLPTPGWRQQNAPVAVSDPGFDGITLTAKTLAVLCKVPWDLFEDVSAQASLAIEAALTTSLALELDRAAYFGDGTNDAPTGLVNTAGVTKTPTAANGAVPTNYADLVAAYFAVRKRNAVPNAAVYAERTAETYAGLTASDGQPLLPPPALADLAQFSTTAMPTDEDQGTSTGVASSIIVGQFDQLAIGFRPEVGFRVVSSREPFMENMQVAVLAYVRADVGVIHPAAFEVRTGILAA
jgi:HK97 family phage major capsid protein